MDLTMDIAQMSVGMHQAQAQQSLGIAVAKMAMDSGNEAQDRIDETTATIDPSHGNSVDIYA